MALRGPETSGNDLPQGEIRKTDSPGRMRPVEDLTSNESDDIKRQIWNACAQETGAVRSVEDFKNSMAKVAITDVAIFDGLYRALHESKQGPVFDVLCKLASWMFETYQDPKKGSILSPFTKVTSQQLLTFSELALQKSQEQNKGQRMMEAGDLLGEIHQAVRIEDPRDITKIIEDFKTRTDIFPPLTDEEKSMLDKLGLASLDTSTNVLGALRNVTSRVLTGFLNAEKRSQMVPLLTGTKPEDFRKLALHMFQTVVERPTISMTTVDQMLQKSGTQVHKRPTPVPGAPRAEINPGVLGHPERPPAPQTQESVVRKMVTKRITAILDSGHLGVATEDLLKEQIISPENSAYKLLQKIQVRLKELEETKGTERLKRALQDFAGKIVYTLRNSESKKNVDRFRVLSRILKRMENLLDLLAIIMNLKDSEDIKRVQEEIDSNELLRMRWNQTDRAHLMRVKTYIETGEKTKAPVEDSERREAREERFKRALEDCSSLIVLGLCSPVKEKAEEGFEAKTKDLIRQIEVDAQGLEIKDLDDESSVVEAMGAHAKEHITDESEKERAEKASQLMKEQGVKQGLKTATRNEQRNAHREARKARQAGLFDLSDVENLLNALDE